jgi:hypothetical protein
MLAIGVLWCFYGKLLEAGKGESSMSVLEIVLVVVVDTVAVTLLVRAVCGLLRSR